MSSIYLITFDTIENKIEDNHGDKLRKPKNIISPTEPLQSENIKIITENGYMVRRYIDNNIERKKDIITYLENIVQIPTLNKFFDKVNKIMEKNRYFIQSDIIGAGYNTTLETVYSLIDEFVINESHNVYLKGYFKHIQETYNEENYLYVTEYSDFLFTLYLNKIFKDEKVLFKKDDMLIYGDDIGDLNNRFEKISMLLKENGLYINPKKTFILDTIYDSIYIFKTIVSIPKIKILDERLKILIKERIKNNKTLNIYTLDDILYNFILSLKSYKNSLNIKVYNNLAFYKRIYYYFNKKIYYSDKDYVPNNYNYFKLELFKEKKPIDLSVCCYYQKGQNSSYLW